MREKTAAGAGSAISVKDALDTSLAENTRAAYWKGWSRFAAWCRSRDLDPMAATPDDVADFLVTMASEPRSPRATTGHGRPLALGTIRVLIAAINRRYREANRNSPAGDIRVRSVLRGLGRLEARRPRRVKALRVQEIARILARCDELAADMRQRVIAARDAAVIALGFAAALRRAELCALEVADVEFLRRGEEVPGAFVHVRRSKTDQLGRGERVAVPEGKRVRTVSRLRAWLQLSGVVRGPLFRTMRRGGHVQERPLHPTDVARMVKRWARAIGLDPAEYSGHSLRAGFVTSAAAHGARLDKIMEVTRHRGTSMVLRYIRQADAFEDHAGAGFL
ncbi:MAG: site-specific integrase [Holophagales bacterium]|nr:site-specific integrase [Holophagales bacterium]MYF94983.1 site-specific integrase [Holophagales bacterium]